MKWHNIAYWLFVQAGLALAFIFNIPSYAYGCLCHQHL